MAEIIDIKIADREFEFKYSGHIHRMMQGFNEETYTYSGSACSGIVSGPGFITFKTDWGSSEGSVRRIYAYYIPAEHLGDGVEAMMYAQQSDDPLLTVNATFLSWEWEPIYTNWLWPEVDIALDYEITYTGTYQLRAKYYQTSQIDNDDERIYHQYVDSHDPHGLPPMTLEYYYEWPLTMEVHQVIGSIIDETATISCSGGFGMMGQISFAGNGTWDAPRDYMNGVIDGPVHIGTMTLTGCGDYSVIDESYNEVDTYFDISGTILGNSSGATIDLTADGRAYSEDFQNVGVLLDTNSYTITNSGSITHLDDTPVEGALVQLKGNTGTVSTDENGDFTWSKQYDGIWECYFYGSTPTASASETQEIYGAFSNGETLGDGIRNLAALEEPDFTITNTNAEWDAIWQRGGGDGNIEIIAPEEGFSWDDGLVISTPASKLVTNKTGWTRTGSSGTITNGTNYIAIQGLCGGITKNCSADNWKGGRYLNVKYTANDTEPITITTAQGSWSITPSKKRIDLLNPDTSFASDTAQSGVYLGGNIGWSWGVDNPGQVTISGLRTGKGYVFYGLELVRLSEEEGGSIKVMVHPNGAFCSTHLGDNRLSSPYLQHASTNVINNLITEEIYRQQTAIVFVDGMPAAEICGIRHVETTLPGSTVSWTHLNLDIGNQSDIFFPADGFVTFTTGTKTTAWHTDDTGIGWLKPGVHTGYNDIGVGLAVNPTLVKLPATEGDRTLAYKKYFRGRGAALLVDGSGGSTPRTFTINSYTKNGGTLLDTTTCTTDATGFALTPSLKQAQSKKVVFTAINAGRDILTTSTNCSAYVGCEIFVPTNSTSVPSMRTISSANATTITLSAPLATTAYMYGYIQIPYYHEAVVTDGGSVERKVQIDFRNHAYKWAAMRLVWPHGLLYDSVSGILHYHTDGKLEYL